eukprot:c9436_g1_i1 orf=66-620(-)
MVANVQHIQRSYQIEKLNSSNYNIWAVKMEMLLVHSELWQYVNGNEPQPTPVIAAGDAANTPPTNQAAITQWNLVDSKARSNIILHCCDRQIQLVSALPTSRDVWQKLCATYEHSDVVSQVTLLRRLMQLMLVYCRSVTEFLEEWQGLLDEAARTGLTFSDIQQVTMLLASLPDSWRSFVTTQS